MPILEVQAPTIKDTTGAGTTLAYASNVTAGSNLILGMRVGGAGGDQSTTVTGTGSETWVKAVHRFDAAFGYVDIWYKENTASSGAYTVTVGYGVSTTCRLSIHEYSGLAISSSVDQTNSGQGDSVPTSGYDITTLSANELIFAVMGNQAVDTVSAEALYTLKVQNPAAPNTRMAVQDQIVSATGTYHGAFSETQDVGSSPRWVACIASFKAAGAVVGSGPILTINRMEIPIPAIRRTQIIMV
jgi:hypothetical protein